MVYLAGDNNLENSANKDLAEMKLAGPTADVAVVAQLDRMSDAVTRRYYLRAGTSLDDDLLAELPETNTGDPNCLVDFAAWAVEKYPARHYALVLWNHGSGWKEDNIYQAAQRSSTPQETARQVMRGISSRKRHSLFHASLDWCLQNPERAIAYDDSSEDFLDNAELKKALGSIALKTGQKLDLLGFDACLMNMLEVHYQLRELVMVVVGSQELEPGDGWPYHTILKSLTQQPNLTPDQFGAVVVDAYTDYYQPYAPNVVTTQSAIAVARLAPAVAAVDLLAKALRSVHSDQALRGLVYAACRSAQKFSDSEYFDLASLCTAIIKASQSMEISHAAQQVLDILRGNETPILAARSLGRQVRSASGISIYLPMRNLSPLYSGLDFAQACDWGNFLKRLVGQEGLA